MTKQEFENLCNEAFEDIFTIFDTIRESDAKKNAKHLLIQLSDFKKFALEELYDEETK